MSDIYYFAISFEDDWSAEDKISYIQTFMENDKILEYKVKLTEIKENFPNNKQLGYTFEILDILFEDKSPFKSTNDKIGDTVWAWDYYRFCDLDKKTLSYHPQCGINDGGCLNCSGCYRSLVIPYDEYEKYGIPKPIRINGQNLIVDLEFTKCKYSGPHILNIELKENCDKDTNSYILYRKGNLFGYMNKDKFEKLENENNYKLIANFLANHYLDI